MKQKLKVLVLAHEQFGYSITKFKHCEFARGDFDITYIGWDYGKSKINLSGVTVHYISRASNVVARNIRLFRAFHNEIGKGYDLVFANYLRGIALIKIFNPYSKFILHIDTLGVEQKKSSRLFRDLFLKTEARLFKNIAVISKGIAHKIGLNKFDVLPLGGDCFTTKARDFERLSLLYVGTLNNRNIIDCVKGFHKYLNTQTGLEVAKSHFTIIGDSPFGELVEIRKYIIENDLAAYITTTGFVHSERLKPYYEDATVGISYVPIEPYYEFQPPTKTFEYLISGLPVIATATEANKEIVTADVSELISDDSDSFCAAIVSIVGRRNQFDSSRIRLLFQDYTWGNVVHEKLVPLINRVYNSY